MVYFTRVKIKEDIVVYISTYLKLVYSQYKYGLGWGYT